MASSSAQVSSGAQVTIDLCATSDEDDEPPPSGRGGMIRDRLTAL